ncbi:MAG: hypothetical protein JSW27_01660 [Phycisphaerales bacterium]|nr:MAG: hypothetical protein JSW27_01660 [Phycisphaerales bacterium]
MIELIELLKLAHDAQTQEEVSQSLAGLAQAIEIQDAQIRALQIEAAGNHFMIGVSFWILFGLICVLAGLLAWQNHQLAKRIAGLEAR